MTEITKGNTMKRTPLVPSDETNNTGLFQIFDVDADKIDFILLCRMKTGDNVRSKKSMDYLTVLCSVKRT